MTKCITQVNIRYLYWFNDIKRMFYTLLEQSLTLSIINLCWSWTLVIWSKRETPESHWWKLLRRFPKSNEILQPVAKTIMTCLWKRKTGIQPNWLLINSTICTKIKEQEVSLCFCQLSLLFCHYQIWRNITRWRWRPKNFWETSVIRLMLSYSDLVLFILKLCVAGQCRWA